MHKLTLQQIQFIDKYLETSGVEYVDVRFEMTDHIATALEGKEGGFMENFRLYMLEHKQELLGRFKDFKKLAARKAFRIISRALLHPACLMAIATIFGLQFLFTAYARDMVTEAYQIGYVAVQLAAFAALIYFRVLNKKNFSITGQLFWIWLFCGFIYPVLFSASEYILRGYYTVTTVLLVVTLTTFFKLYKQYNLQYTAVI